MVLWPIRARVLFELFYNALQQSILLITKACNNDFEASKGRYFLTRLMLYSEKKAD